MFAHVQALCIPLKYALQVSYDILECGPAWSAASLTDERPPSPVRLSPPQASAVLARTDSTLMCCTDTRT